MSEATDRATFDRKRELEGDAAPTLIEGLPGHGLVASIAVDQITRQLELPHYGSIRSSAFPAVASFNEGRLRDPVRVYAGDGVMTLQSDVPLPEAAFDVLSTCVLKDLAPEFERAIFLAGAPAQSEEQIGDVTAVATSDAVEAELEAAGVPLAEGSGLIGGVTGALVSACGHAELPSAVLIAKAHPYVPDPAAARAVIEDALEPLVHFDIDTTELAEQADHIQAQLQQIAQRYQQLAEEESGTPTPPTGPSMYQ